MIMWSYECFRVSYWNNYQGGHLDEIKKLKKWGLKPVSWYIFFFYSTKNLRQTDFNAKSLSQKCPTLNAKKKNWVKIPLFGQEINYTETKKTKRYNDQLFYITKQNLP